MVPSACFGTRSSGSSLVHISKSMRLCAFPRTDLPSTPVQRVGHSERLPLRHTAFRYATLSSKYLIGLTCAGFDWSDGFLHVPPASTPLLLSQLLGFRLQVSDFSAAATATFRFHKVALLGPRQPESRRRRGSDRLFCFAAAWSSSRPFCCSLELQAPAVTPRGRSEHLTSASKPLQPHRLRTGLGDRSLERKPVEATRLLLLQRHATSHLLSRRQR